MIVGFSSHGRGKAAGPIAYLTDRVRGGVERDPAPTVLRGEPQLVAALIDGSRFRHRYTSGVLSFAPGEEIDAALQSEIMDRFEATAFAGLETDQYAILCVRHDQRRALRVEFPHPARRALDGQKFEHRAAGTANSRSVRRLPNLR